jgi:hypothetical protein
LFRVRTRRGTGGRSGSLGLRGVTSCPREFSFPFVLRVALAAAIFASIEASPAGAWELVVSGEGRELRIPLPADRFELSWVHSVERTEWRETYAVERSRGIVLVASEFLSSGAGLPDRVGEGETFRMKDGRMRVEGRDVAVGEFTVRLSDVSRHNLWAGSRRVDLNAAFGEGVVTIRAER